MEFEGKYKIKALLTMDEEGSRFISREDIENLEFNEENADYIHMLRVTMEIKEDVILMKVRASEEEARSSMEEDPDIYFDDDGLLVIEKHPLINVDGEWKYECGEEDGQPYYASFGKTEDGDLLYAESIVFEKIQ